MLDIQNNNIEQATRRLPGPALARGAGYTAAALQHLHGADAEHERRGQQRGAAYWKDADGIVHLKGKLTNSTGGVAVNLVTHDSAAGWVPAFGSRRAADLQRAQGSGRASTMVFVGTDPGTIACSASNNGDGTTGTGIVNGDAVLHRRRSSSSAECVMSAARRERTALPVGRWHALHRAFPRSGTGSGS
jgi:hypothetical protein